MQHPCKHSLDTGHDLPECQHPKVLIKGVVRWNCYWPAAGAHKCRRPGYEARTEHAPHVEAVVENPGLAWARLDGAEPRQGVGGR